MIAIIAIIEVSLETFTIITGNPNELVAPIHNRMPVILVPANYARWLDVEQPDAVELLRPYPAEAMTAYPVSTGVNCRSMTTRRLSMR